MTELLDFIKSSNITPQQAQEKVQSLISSGQMSQQQFETLKQQAQVSELKTQNMFCGVPRISPYGYGVVPNFATPCGCNGVTF